MANGSQELRAMLTPLAGQFVLLPNSVVAEVVAFSEPEPYEQAPDWLLGELDWNDWQAPIVDLARLADIADRGATGASSHVLIIKSLAGSSSIMYLGLRTSGLPKLIRLTPEDLEADDGDTGSGAVFAKVSVDGQTALIPELEILTGMVEREIYAA